MFVTKTQLVSVRAIVARMAALVAEVANLCVGAVLRQVAQLQAALALNLVGAHCGNMSAVKDRKKTHPG